MKRILLPCAFLALPLATLACQRHPDAETHREKASLADALRPAFFADALGRAGGGHYHGTARFAAGLATPDDGVTTTTDVWVDRARNFRLVESNDRDGGREIVRVGRELAVALRYGKMIRRVAEAPEPTLLLEEGLGAPWAAWELASPVAAIAGVGAPLVGGAKATEYRVSRATRSEEPATHEAAKGLRAWRATVVVDQLSGRAVVDDATGALLAVDLSATFTTKREGHDLKGSVEVHGALTDVASVATIAPPPAQDLALRQRIVPEERELLAGLPTTRPLPQAAPKPAARAATPPPARKVTP